MKQYTKHTTRQVVSSLLMIVALLWLTVSTPFVYAAQQQVAQQENPVQDISDEMPVENEESNPLSGTSEEKTPSSTNLSEEYLHGHPENMIAVTSLLSHLHFHSYGLYVAYHGELLCPPPNFSVS